MRKYWHALLVAVVFSGVLAVSVPPANAVTTFCNGYDTWDIPHITRDLKFKVCLSYWSGGNLQSYGYAYIENCGSTCQSHVDGFVMSTKIEKPLGTVRWSNPCDFANEATSSPGRYCEVGVENIADQESYFATLRVTVFYTDGHSSNLSSKLCQRGTGPNNTPSSC